MPLLPAPSKFVSSCAIIDPAVTATAVVPGVSLYAPGTVSDAPVISPLPPTVSIVISVLLVGPVVLPSTVSMSPAVYPVPAALIAMPLTLYVASTPWY